MLDKWRTFKLNEKQSNPTSSHFIIFKTKAEGLKPKVLYGK